MIHSKEQSKGKDKRQASSESCNEPVSALEVELVARSQTEQCPICKEAPDESLPLTCVSCKAKYHLGCIGESQSRRCVSCHARVVPPAKSYLSKIFNGNNWGRSTLYILFSMPAFFLILTLIEMSRSTFVASFVIYGIAFAISSQLIKSDEAFAKAEESRKKKRQEKIQGIKEKGKGTPELARESLK